MVLPVDPQLEALVAIVSTSVALVSPTVLTPVRSNCATERMGPLLWSARRLAPSLVLGAPPRSWLSLLAKSVSGWKPK